MTEFPAISLWQPWASLLFAKRADGQAVKVHETRNRPVPPKYLGQRILIHATRQPIVEAKLHPLLRERCIEHLGPSFARDVPFGAFIGTVLIEDCTLMAMNGHGEPLVLPAHVDDEVCGYWEEGRWAWRFADPQEFRTPIEAPGYQGWFTARIPEMA